MKNINNWVKDEGTRLLRKIGIKSGQTILDFGCGKGNYSIPAAKIIGNKGRVYSIDKNSKALAGLEERAKKENLTNINTINNFGKIKTNLKDNLIDVVLLYDIIHLVGKNDSSVLQDRKKLYKEIFRVTKPNALVSVYPMHLSTHTDINNINEVKKELLDSGFGFEKEININLIHDDFIVNGKVLNFRKKSK